MSGYSSSAVRRNAMGDTEPQGHMCVGRAVSPLSPSLYVPHRPTLSHVSFASFSAAFQFTTSPRAASTSQRSNKSKKSALPKAITTWNCLETRKAKQSAKENQGHEEDVCRTDPFVCSPIFWYQAIFFTLRHQELRRQQSGNHPPCARTTKQKHTAPDVSISDTISTTLVCILSISAE